jgi:tellurite resistance protein
VTPPTLRELVENAISDLCDRFGEGGYHPTPIIDLGLLVARADGQVDASEREMLREIFEELLGTELSLDVVDHLIRASLEVIDAAGVEPRARLVAQILCDCDAVEQGLLVAIAIAFASEGLSASERSLLEGIARQAEFPLDRLEQLIARVKAVLPEKGNARDSLTQS